jgi:hypothetical protein
MIDMNVAIVAADVFIVIDGFGLNVVQFFIKSLRFETGIYINIIIIVFDHVNEQIKLLWRQF